MYCFRLILAFVTTILSSTEMRWYDWALQAVKISVYKGFISEVHRTRDNRVFLILFGVAEMQQPQDGLKAIPCHLITGESEVIRPFLSPEIRSVVDSHKASGNNDSQEDVEVFDSQCFPFELFASSQSLGSIGICVVNQSPDNCWSEKQLEESDGRP